MIGRGLATSIRLGLDASGATSGLDDLTRRFRGAGDDMSGSMLGVSSRVLAIGSAAVAATAALGAMAAEASAAARQTELAYAEVQTIADSAVFPLERIQDISRGLAATYGSGIEEQAGALYQAISAGATSSAAALDTLHAANQLAIGGLAETGDAINVLTTVVNSWAASNLSATDAADAMFTAVRLGKTTVPELSSALGQVAPIAAAAGLRFDEVAASVASITASGVETAEAVTQLRSLLVSIIAPKSKAAAAAKQLGIEYNLSALRAEGLQGFLQKIAESGATEEQIQKLTGRVEGLSAVLSLTSNEGKRFAAALDGMEDKAGAAAKAADTIGATLQKRLDGIAAIWNNIADVAGTWINGFFVEPAVAVVEDFSRAVAHLTGTTGDAAKAQAELSAEIAKTPANDVIAQVRREEAAREDTTEAIEKQTKATAKLSTAQRQAIRDAPFSALDSIAEARVGLDALGLGDETLDQAERGILGLRDSIGQTEVAIRSAKDRLRELQSAASQLEDITPRQVQDAASDRGEYASIVETERFLEGFRSRTAEAIEATKREIASQRGLLRTLRGQAQASAEGVGAELDVIAAAVRQIQDITRGLDERDLTDPERIRKQGEAALAALEKSYAELGAEVPADLRVRVTEATTEDIRKAEEELAAELRDRRAVVLEVGFAANDDPAAEVQRREAAKLDALREALQEELITREEHADAVRRVEEGAARERNRIQVGAVLDTSEEIAGLSSRLAREIIGYADARADAEVAAMQRAGATEEAIAAKRDQLQKEAFERQKGLRLAEAAINTAAGVARALSENAWPYSAVVGALVAAAGVAQIATIASTQYQSAGAVSAPSPATPPSSFDRRDDVRDRGGSGGGTVVNVTFQGPTSSRRASRELRDVMERTG